MSAAPRLRLWLLRHTRPLVQEGVCYGAMDVPVSAPEATRAAQTFVAALKAQDASPTRLWVSQRQRAQVLADAVCAVWQPSLTPQVDARLNEFDFGHWEGTAWSDMPKHAMDTWTADFAHHRFGGQDSTSALVRRVHAALRDVRATSSGDVVWVTHAGVVRAVQWLMQRVQGFGEEPASEEPATEQPISEQPCSEASLYDQLRADQWPVHAPSFGAWQQVNLP